MKNHIYCCCYTWNVLSHFLKNIFEKYFWKFKTELKNEQFELLGKIDMLQDRETEMKRRLTLEKKTNDSLYEHERRIRSDKFEFQIDQSQTSGKKSIDNLHVFYLIILKFICPLLFS